MPRDGNATLPPRRRSRTVRAAALVTLGLGAVGCDESPPADLPGQAEARLNACRAAHVRLGEDPARCDLLEQVIAREQASTRPQFTTISACEATFGRGACEGETLAATGPNWRPTLVGWARTPQDLMQPVLQDRASRYWALPDPVMPSGGTIATQPAPRSVEASDVVTGTPSPGESAYAYFRYAYFRLAPIYPDQATCTADWQSCERFDIRLPNRFATLEACRAAWSQCIEVELPDSALVMAEADATPAPEQSSQANRTAGSGYYRAGWWYGYNSRYRQTYARGIGPRYQGWTWTADHRPTAAYRPAYGTGPLQAWDSGTRRLAAANSMGVYTSGSGSRVTGTTISRPTSTIARAGFGSTGRSYSSGG